MAKKRKTFTDEFKQDAVQFVASHPEMTISECAEALGVGRSTLERWRADFNRCGLSAEADQNHDKEEKDLLKENIRLQRELRDSQEALKILKKAISILGS
ncbi:transposase [Faecalibaculum rodentium]|uniref:transposase n=1 Tax=Faecalibaculum rodentium TaxID=1702221 RepID=UPI003F66D617